MKLFIKGVKHYGNVVDFQIFYAKDVDDAKKYMVANHGAKWSETHTLCGVEAFQITA